MMAEQQNYPDIFTIETEDCLNEAMSKIEAEDLVQRYLKDLTLIYRAVDKCDHETSLHLFSHILESRIQHFVVSGRISQERLNHLEGHALRNAISQIRNKIKDKKKRKRKKRKVKN